MKKVLAAALICAASSFAAWDYFPVIEHGKGEAKVGISQSRQGNQGGGGSEFEIRYSPLANLELMSSFRNGFGGDYILGARYQIIPVLSAGVDVGFPIPGTAWSFTPNVQFSMPLTEALEFGSNVEVTINTEDSNKNTKDMELSAGVEFDLAVGKSTIWVSCDLNMVLSDSKTNPEIAPSLGYIATVGNLALGTNIGLEFVEDAKLNTIIGVDFSIKF